MIGRRKKPGGHFHPLIPPFIELRCRCGGKVTCLHPTNSKGYSDTPEGWFMRTKEDKAFTAKCDQCQLSKADLNYFDLKDFGEPFYSASVGKESIWGWNSEHLAMVIDYLEGKDIGNNRWRIYKQFVPGSWKRPSRRIAFIKAARKVLNDP